jgi:hypothetical protein
MSKTELDHAVRYAIEATKLFLMEQYTRLYPHIFTESRIETRLATMNDYYVPDSIAGQCIVVVKTFFTETGCHRLACFPFKSNMEPCEETDDPQWIPLGKGFTIACQPHCRETTQAIDTEWRKRCVEVNPYKKILAMLPEHAMGRKAKQHGGLDWVNGHIRLTAEYCKEYGLDFDGYECTSTTGQQILEWFIGKTVYRTIKKSSSSIRGTPPVNAPPYFNYPQHTLQRLVSTDNDTETMNFSKLAKDIAIELGIDFGVDVSATVVERLLTRHVPKLLDRALNNISIKTAVKQSVLQSSALILRSFSMATGKMIGMASNILTAYGIVAAVLDVIDIYDYDKVLDGRTVDEIDFKLDLRYFGREDDFDRTITPEYVWDNVLVSVDLSDRYEFMAEKISEYLSALHTKPIKLPPIKKNVLPIQNRWNLILHWSLVSVLAVLSLLWSKWIHVWGVVLLASMIFYNGTTWY